MGRQKYTPMCCWSHPTTTAQHYCHLQQNSAPFMQAPGIDNADATDCRDMVLFFRVCEQCCSNTNLLWPVHGQHWSLLIFGPTLEKDRCQSWSWPGYVSCLYYQSASTGVITPGFLSLPATQFTVQSTVSQAGPMCHVPTTMHLPLSSPPRPGCR